MFGEWLKQQREARGFSQEEMARRAHLTQGYFSRLELNKHPNPSQKVLRQIATGLDVPLATVIRAAWPDATLSLTQLAAEGLDTQFLRELARLEHLLTPEDRAALIRHARALAQRAPTQVHEEPTEYQPGT